MKQKFACRGCTGNSNYCSGSSLLFSHPRRRVQTEITHDEIQYPESATKNHGLETDSLTRCSQYLVRIGSCSIKEWNSYTANQPLQRRREN